MTGKGILEALSFVDEKYIEEAESGTLRRTRPIIKVLLPMAACFCLAFLGLFLTDQARPTEQMSAEQEPADGMPETAYVEKSESVMYGQNDIALDEAELEAPSTDEQPSVIVRIDEWMDTGFMGTVVELTCVNYFEIGSQLTIIPVEDASLFVFAIQTSETTSKLESRIPTREELPEGSVVLIQFYEYDRINETLYINWITSDLREWRD